MVSLRAHLQSSSPTSSSYSHREIDIESITDYVEMLFAVPEYQREVVELVIVNEIEGDDCVSGETRRIFSLSFTKSISHG